MNMNEYAKEINRISTEHGFWPEEGRNFGEMIALAHSELSEALEEHRSGRPVHYLAINPAKTLTPDAEAVLQKMYENMEAVAADGSNAHDITKAEERLLVAQGIAKPEGAAVELVDCIIRCLDTLQGMVDDIDSLMEEKMAYNDSRPHKHGKAY